jgi:hypothetical protein
VIAKLLRRPNISTNLEKKDKAQNSALDEDQEVSPVRFGKWKEGEIKKKKK